MTTDWRTQAACRDRNASPRRSESGRSSRHYRACLEGDAPAEVLPPNVRELLVAVLHNRGWTDLEIACHTRMTLYTTARIRSRLGLSPNRVDQEVA